MFISHIGVKNFRLLKDVKLSLEIDSTIIVGRNNSGKTSLTELLKRILYDSTPKFNLEDFSLSIHEQFWDALKLRLQNQSIDSVKEKLPKIEADLFFQYTPGENLGALNPFVIDLERDATKAQITVNYLLRDGELNAFFEGFKIDNEIEDKKKFFKEIRTRIPKFYHTKIWAVDPNDLSNKKEFELSDLKELIQTNFITAQRGLDDTTHREKDVLGRVLEKLFTSAAAETSHEVDKDRAKKIEDFVTNLQSKIDEEFAKHLASLLPGLKLFGYPGLNDPRIRTETILNVQSLLSDFTKLKYEGQNGIGLPETYNGLGSRNLIFILFQMFEFFKSFRAKAVTPSFHLVFIEEPEAHLHPQMQEVFIRKINEIADVFTTEINEGQRWPVQFVVTTHSTHMSNEANIESIRYFLNKPIQVATQSVQAEAQTTQFENQTAETLAVQAEAQATHVENQTDETLAVQAENQETQVESQTEKAETQPVDVDDVLTQLEEGIIEAVEDPVRAFIQNGNREFVFYETKIKDLREGFNKEPLSEDKDFLHKFLTLTSCDLFFCDKAILVEGTSERLLLPKFIEKVDLLIPEKDKLSSQYLTVFQVGGAYSSRFFNFLDYLELKALIITDLDSTIRTISTGVNKRTTYPAALVEVATHTSNSSIKKWFSGEQFDALSPANLLAKTSVDKIKSRKRICYQIPETGTNACGRSFEDAFMLANTLLYEIAGTDSEKAKQAWELASSLNKTDFALGLGVNDDNWNVPKYIMEGLVWLSENTEVSLTNEVPQDQHE